MKVGTIKNRPKIVWSLKVINKCHYCYLSTFIRDTRVHSFFLLPSVCIFPQVFYAYEPLPNLSYYIQQIKHLVCLFVENRLFLLFQMYQRNRNKE